jgi:predicted nucleotidyltransferase
MKRSDLSENTPEQKLAKENCLLLMRTGSVLYGTNIPGKSDNDFQGVFMPPEPCFLGLKNMEQVFFGTNDSASGKKNTAEDTDCCLYALPKFVSLLLNNNPNTLETLFVPENCQLFSTALGKRLYESRSLFVSKKAYFSFKGYSEAQLKRLERGESNGTGRQDLIQKHGYDTKMASHVMRLFFEANELLSTGNITLPLKQNGVVLTVKRGEWDKERFMSEANKAKAECAEVFANCKLRDTPDYEGASDLLVGMVKDYYGYGVAKKSVSFRSLVAGLLKSTANYLEN